ncbi:MAG: PEP-CTERM sorting domain-containing protein [Nibricoccus sp.]
MRAKLVQIILSAGLCVSAVTAARSQVIGFEDLNTRDNFTRLGIVDSYQGFEWGYGTNAGLAYRTFANTFQGWAVATASDEAVSPEPVGLAGHSYAWNWDSPRSLWIDFKSNVDFLQSDFAFLSPGYGFNASSIQLFGYDAADNLVEQSAVFFLSETFETLNAGFTDIRYLEIRTIEGRHLAVDNLVIAPASAVPEPSTYGAVGALALVALVAYRARRPQKAAAKN